MVGEVTFAVIGLLFLIADIRTFSSTFQQTFFGQSNTTLGVMATAVFATSLLAPIVGWWLGLLHASRPPDRPSPLAVALPIAFSSDLVLRAAFRTVPPVDLNPALAAPLVLVASLVFLAAGGAAKIGRAHV